MKIEVGKEYRVLVSALGFKRDNIIGIEDEDVDCKDNFCIILNQSENRRVPKKYIQMLELEAYGEQKRKIKVGNKYRALRDYGLHKKGDVLEVIYIDKEDGNRVDFLSNGTKGDFDSLAWFENAELEEIDLSKPPHCDTTIDTIAFSKANFPAEQVKGFLRISAIECLQANEGYSLESLNKASRYIQELISMESK